MFELTSYPYHHKSIFLENFLRMHFKSNADISLKDLEWNRLAISFELLSASSISLLRKVSFKKKIIIKQKSNIVVKVMSVVISIHLYFNFGA